MGMLATVFAATAAEATSTHMVEQGPGPAIPSIDFHGLDDLKIATLTAICNGMDLNDIDAVVALSPEVVQRDENGPWVFPVPRPLADQLTALNTAQRREVARRWGRTEEWAVDPSEEEAFAVTFEVFCEFVAKQHGKEVWVWMCL